MYRYGPPPTLGALCAVIEQDMMQRVWRDYTANAVWSIARTMYKEYPMPSFTEFIEQGSKPRDERTGQQIIDDLIKKLQGGD